MGYRSEVRCVIYGTKENLDAYITQVRLIDNNNQVFLDFEDSLTRYIAKISRYSDATQSYVDENVHVLDLYGDAWKWYEDFEDVKRWEKFMRESEQSQLDYEFVRVGEEYDDIVLEQSENAVGLLGTSTVINDDIDKQGEDLPLSF